MIARSSFAGFGTGQRSLLKGLAAGLAGGLVAFWIVRQTQSVEKKATEAVSHSRLGRKLFRTPGGNGHHRSKVPSTAEPMSSATVKSAPTMTNRIFGQPALKVEKPIPQAAVHYTPGVLMGGLYGAAAELLPGVTTGAGSVYGAMLWAASDELAIPRLQLTSPPQRSSAGMGMEPLANHVLYGLVTEAVRRAIRAVW